MTPWEAPAPSIVTSTYVRRAAGILPDRGV